MGGYNKEYDEWVGADRLRSKALKPAKGDAPGKKVTAKKERPRVYSLADQVARFARAQKEGNKRYLDMPSIYDPKVYEGKRVLVVGANKGLGLELVKHLNAAKAIPIATCRTSSPELDAEKPQIITGVEVTSF